MRRKSERAATKKAKASPEKKVEKGKRTRTRRRKQSTSSENDSEEGSPVREVVKIEESPKVAPTTPAKEPSPEDTPDQVWQVKTAESSGDGGEIHKLKICLTRPSSTPERADRSPRSKRKHSRATSSSDTPSVEGVDEKRKSRRSKRNRESRDESDKNQDSQGDEPEGDSENVHDKSDNEISQSTQPSQETVSDDTPMSTTNEEKLADPSLDKEKITDPDVQDKSDKTSDADTTVASPKPEAQDCRPEVNTPEKESPEPAICDSVDKSEVLEIHIEDNKIESSEPQSSKAVNADSKEEEADHSIDEGRASIDCEVSITEDKVKQNNCEDVESTQTVTATNTNENDVVESSENVENSRIRKMSVDSDKDKDVSVDANRSKNLTNTDPTQPKQEENVHNGQAAPFVVSRKRKWGSRPKITSQKSITISTDILKEIIPDVKPVEFDEVIEEKKHKRIEVIEKIERPVLPKITIDNTENVEQLKKDNDDKEKENLRKETNLSMNRRISIVKDSDSIIARPPSPPRHKQSNILYITNLVRPFTLPQLKNLLQRTGRIAENGFWIDRIKSKCFVQYENEDQAVETRHALHGVTWPVSNPKTLQVDFSSQEAFDKAKLNEDTDNAQASTIPGTVEDWLREQDLKRERGEVEKPWERKATMREWDVGKNEKDKDNKDKLKREDRPLEKRRHRSQERSPEPARKFKKKEEEAPAKLLDDLFRKTKTTPCIYWLPLSAETIAVKEEQRRQHMAEHERRMLELRRTQHRRH